MGVSHGAARKVATLFAANVFDSTVSRHTLQVAIVAKNSRRGAGLKPGRHHFNKSPHRNRRKDAVRPYNLRVTTRSSVLLFCEIVLRDSAHASEAHITRHRQCDLAGDREMIADRVNVHADIDAWNQVAARERLELRSLRVAVYAAHDDIHITQLGHGLLPLHRKTPDAESGINC